MEGKQCVVKVNDLLNISADSERWSKRSIYKIPKTITKLNKRAYKPQIVSFGPYHHDMEHLKAMDQHKDRALNQFLWSANETLESLIEALTPIVQDLKDAYDQLDAKWMEDDNRFLEMLIVDGCFVFEMLRTTNTDASKEYASNDPVFSKHGKLYFVPYIKGDMLMLENQIPMKVLEELASKIRLEETQLNLLILDFFSQRIPSAKFQEFIECKHLHILDVYRKSLLFDERIPREEPTRPSMRIHRAIRSVTELKEVGISFEKSNSRSLKDITFDGGVLKLPEIYINDSLVFLYLNMIAYERFHIGAGNEVTSYVFFMNSMIDNARDVRLLRECEIVQNSIGSDEAVANLFSSLFKETTLDQNNTTMWAVYEEVADYCEKPSAKWRKWEASLWNTYFTNPWVIISLVAAILLFVLTTLQTVFTVLSYVRDVRPQGPQSS